MACFDLIDNVFDASSQFRGRLNNDVDVEKFDRSDSDEDEEKDEDPLKLDTTNCFYILNNCQNPVKPMKDVLTVFNSDKHNARSQICENGVGVKQGCATLSDISFVMSRNEQDFAFGEHDNGQVWKQNLFKWVSAVTKMYYNYYLQNICKKKKTLLTDLVKSLHERAKEKQKTYLASDPNHGKAIDERRVSTFEGIQWDFKSEKIVLTPDSKTIMKHVIGTDIDLFFETVQTSNNSQSKRKSSSNAAQSEGLNNDKEIGNGGDETYDQDMTLATAATTSVRRARRGPKRYREDSEPDEEEEQGKTTVSRSKAPPKSRRQDEESDQLKQTN